MATRSNMTYEKFLAWATPKVSTAAGRREVQRHLEGLVGYANGTTEEQLAQEAIRELGVPNFDQSNLATLTEMGTTVRETLVEHYAEESEQMAITDTQDIATMKELAQITREHQDVLNKARVDSSRLEPRERAIWDRHEALLKAHNDSEARPYTGGTMTTKRSHFVPSELYQIEKLGSAREKAHAIRELKSRWRDDPKSGFSDVRHPDHKSYIDGMRRLYEYEQELGPTAEDPTE